MEDQRSVLKSERPFSFKKIKGAKAIVYHKGKQVMVVSGKRYLKLEAAEQLGDDYNLQLVLAKITGHFKHGNER